MIKIAVRRLQNLYSSPKHIWLMTSLWVLISGSSSAVAMNLPLTKPTGIGMVQLIVTCKSYSNCEQAVRNWCAGAHPRADGDGDGIPCENVCRSRQQVREIEQEIECDR